MKPRPKLRKRSKKSLLKLKPLLDQINNEVEIPDYIQDDPVQFMHAFTDKRDREIAGFFAALMAWGRRDIVVAKVDDLLHRMDYKPRQFVINYSQSDYSLFRGFKHRTFKPIDMHGLTLTLQQILKNYSDFEEFWAECYEMAKKTNRPVTGVFYDRFLNRHPDFAERTKKHLSNPERGSAAKRMYMFLRWCCRKNSPVDTGIWSFIDSSELYIPFDVHVARQARRYGLLSRRTDDWKSVVELTETLRILDAGDPTRYDFALFGIGALGYSLPNNFLLNRV